MANSTLHAPDFSRAAEMQAMSILVQNFEAGPENVRGLFIFKYMAYEIRNILGTDVNKCINKKIVLEQLLEILLLITYFVKLTPTWKLISYSSNFSTNIKLKAAFKALGKKLSLLKWCSQKVSNNLLELMKFTYCRYLLIYTLILLKYDARWVFSISFFKNLKTILTKQKMEGHFWKTTKSEIL